MDFLAFIAMIFVAFYLHMINENLVKLGKIVEKRLPEVKP